MLTVLAQCAEGLAHLHAHGLVHRDVRADNYLVASRDPVRVLISDFGLSHQLSEASAASPSAASGSVSFIGPVGMLCLHQPVCVAK